MPGGRATPGKFSIARRASPLVPGMRAISRRSMVRFVTSRGGRAPRTVTSSTTGAPGGGAAAGWLSLARRTSTFTSWPGSRDSS
jgi:hypothetical protein